MPNLRDNRLPTVFRAIAGAASLRENEPTRRGELGEIACSLWV